MGLGRLVNSILFSEAKRYVTYDKQSYAYSLRHADVRSTEQAEVNIDLNKLSQPIKQQTTDLYEVSTTGDSHSDEKVVKARYIGRNDEYKFTTSTSTGPIFFEVATKSRTVEIALNQNHPLFARLTSLFDLPEHADNTTIRQQLQQAKQTIELLFAAWAKYENELPDGQRKFRAEEARSEWGRNVRLLLMDELADE